MVANSWVRFVKVVCLYAVFGYDDVLKVRLLGHLVWALMGFGHMAWGLGTRCGARPRTSLLAPPLHRAESSVSFGGSD